MPNLEVMQVAKVSDGEEVALSFQLAWGEFHLCLHCLAHSEHISLLLASFDEGTAELIYQQLLAEMVK